MAGHFAFCHAGTEADFFVLLKIRFIADSIPSDENESLIKLLVLKLRSVAHAIANTSVVRSPFLILSFVTLLVINYDTATKNIFPKTCNQNYFVIERFLSIK